MAQGYLRSKFGNGEMVRKANDVVIDSHIPFKVHRKRRRMRGWQISQADLV